MLTPECRTAQPDQVEAVVTDLHDSVLDLASGESLPSYKEARRTARVQWQLPTASGAGVIEVNADASFTDPSPERGLGFFSNVTLTIPTAGGHDYGLFELSSVEPDDIGLTRSIASSGGFDVLDLLHAVDVSTVRKFWEWAHLMLPPQQKPKPIGMQPLQE